MSDLVGNTKDRFSHDAQIQYVTREGNPGQRTGLKCLLRGYVKDNYYVSLTKEAETLSLVQGIHSAQKIA